MISWFLFGSKERHQWQTYAQMYSPTRFSCYVPYADNLNVMTRDTVHWLILIHNQIRLYKTFASLTKDSIMQAKLSHPVVPSHMYNIRDLLLLN